MEGRALWKARVAEQEKSGLNMSEYCRENQISAKSLQRWKQQFSPKFSPVGTPNNQQELKIELKSGAVIKLPLNTNQSLLSQILKVISDV